MNTFTSQKTKSAVRLRPSPWDALVILVILALAGALFFGLLQKSSSADAIVCTVSQNGRVLDTIDLSVGTADQIKTYGDYQLEINHGHVHILSAPCANQNCVHTGWISRAGQSIVCLPGRFVVELSAAEGSGSDIDIVVK